MLVELAVAGRHRAGADRLWQSFVADPEPPLLVTASHGLVEAVDALRRLVRRGLLTAHGGSRAIGWLGQIDLVVDPAAHRLDRIWAWRDRMSAYDAGYAAAAEALGGPLVTVDRRLHRACVAMEVPVMYLDDIA